MTHRLFLDANVLFTAAHRPHGMAAFLFQLQEAPWRLISSAYAIEEARRNLVAKFPHALAEWPALTEALELAPQPAAPRLLLDLPDKDLPIWAAAQAARATHLLTGDLKDFGPYMNCPQRTAGILIQTVGDYLASWLSPR